MRGLVVRCDDLGWTPEEAATPPIKLPDRGLELAQRFHDAMQGVPYLAGIIGACVDEDGAAWLASKPEGLVHAVHGWDHGASRPDVRDEFADLGASEIRERISLARNIIGETAHLIPPYNAVASNLPEAAWHEGIRYIWGQESEWPTPPQPYEHGRVWMIPAWAPLYGGSTFRQGTSAAILDTLAMIDVPAPAVLTVHLPWEAARHEDFRGVRRLIGDIAKHVVHPDEFVAEACR